MEGDNERWLSQAERYCSPLTNWLLWFAPVFVLAATPDLCRADCSHPSPRFQSPSDSSSPAPRLRFMPVSENQPNQNPHRVPADPVRAPCVHCEPSLPSLPPVVTPAPAWDEAIYETP